MSVKLVKFNNNEYYAKDDHYKVSFYGRPRQLLQWLKDAGIAPKQVEIAARTMVEYEHNVAYFGGAGQFMYTKQETLQEEERTS